jgi:hypothetical protein
MAARTLPTMPADYAFSVPAEWKGDAASHWYWYGQAEAIQNEADFDLTVHLRSILPEIACRDDLDALDRRQMSVLADFLLTATARAAMSLHLGELMTLVRLAPEDDGVADDSGVARLMRMLRLGVTREVEMRDMRTQRDRPARRSN